MKEKKLRNRLERVAKIFVEQGVFSDFYSAISRIESDYEKGYPTDSFIEGLLSAQTAGRPLIVNLDERGNYSWLAQK